LEEERGAEVGREERIHAGKGSCFLDERTYFDEEGDSGERLL